MRCGAGVPPSRTDGIRHMTPGSGSGREQRPVQWPHRSWSSAVLYRGKDIRRCLRERLSLRSRKRTSHTVQIRSACVRCSWHHGIRGGMNAIPWRCCAGLHWRPAHSHSNPVSGDTPPAPDNVGTFPAVPTGTRSCTRTTCFLAVNFRILAGAVVARFSPPPTLSHSCTSRCCVWQPPIRVRWWLRLSALPHAPLRPSRVSDCAWMEGR